MVAFRIYLLLLCVPASIHIVKAVSSNGKISNNLFLKYEMFGNKIALVSF